jgi:catechol 2,3-dioxygenase-like lactoylglutathione lyase family enzyme
MRIRRLRYWIYLGVSSLLWVGFRFDLNGAERPPIMRIAHLALYVEDLEKAQAFYGDLLGFAQPLRLYREDGSTRATTFKINDRQFIEIVPGFPRDQVDSLSHIALETSDVEQLREYLLEKGIPVPEKVSKGDDGNLTLFVRDPDGHGVEFVQYLPDSPAMKIRGSYLGTARISDRIAHVGLTVSNLAEADRFYKEILGLSEIWRVGVKGQGSGQIAMRLPEGTDAVEYVMTSKEFERQSLRTLQHLCLQVTDIQKALDILRNRLMEKDPHVIQIPVVGGNNRWHLNLLDPDGNRTELMEPFSIR